MVYMVTWLGYIDGKWQTIYGILWHTYGSYGVLVAAFEWFWMLKIPLGSIDKKMTCHDSLSHVMTLQSRPRHLPMAFGGATWFRIYAPVSRWSVTYLQQCFFSISIHIYPCLYYLCIYIYTHGMIQDMYIYIYISRIQYPSIQYPLSDTVSTIHWYSIQYPSLLYIPMNQSWWLVTYCTKLIAAHSMTQKNPHGNVVKPPRTFKGLDCSGFSWQ